MEFWIQASCPKYTKSFDSDDESLSDAIQTVFPMLTEKAFLIWKAIYIPLCYKYDISIMANDILDMLENLINKSTGDMSIHWASDTFANVWMLEWNNDYLEIEAQWNSVIGGTEQILSTKGSIKIPKQRFIAEWGGILNNVIIGLKQSGYTEDKLCGMSKLIEIFNKVEGKGVLYSD